MRDSNLNIIAALYLFLNLRLKKPRNLFSMPKADWSKSAGNKYFDVAGKLS